MRQQSRWRSLTGGQPSSAHTTTGASSAGGSLGEGAGNELPTRLGEMWRTAKHRVVRDFSRVRTASASCGGSISSNGLASTWPKHLIWPTRTQTSGRRGICSRPAAPRLSRSRSCSSHVRILRRPSRNEGHRSPALQKSPRADLMAARALRQIFTRKMKCPHCRKRLGFFPPPTACPHCGRQIYETSDRRRRY